MRGKGKESKTAAKHDKQRKRGRKQRKRARKGRNGADSFQNKRIPQKKRKKRGKAAFCRETPINKAKCRKNPRKQRSAEPLLITRKKMIGKIGRKEGKTCRYTDEVRQKSAVLYYARNIFSKASITLSKRFLCIKRLFFMAI